MSQKCVGDRGSAGGAYSTPPDPLAGFEGQSGGKGKRGKGLRREGDGKGKGRKKENRLWRQKVASMNLRVWTPLIADDQCVM